MSRPRARLVAVALMVVGALGSSAPASAGGRSGAKPAAAKPVTAEPRVAVIGDDTGGVTAAVREALDGKVEVITIDVEGDAAADVVALAREHRLAAVITVAVSGTRRKSKAVVTVRQGVDGASLGNYTTRGKRARLARATADKAWKSLHKAIGKAVAPEPEPPEPEDAERPVAAAPAPAPRPRAAASTDAATLAATGTATAGATAGASAADVGVRAAPRTGASVPWLVLTVDGRPFLRQLRYTDDLDQRLRSYDLAAPAAGITAIWRPRARGAARFFALRGELELALGVNGSRTSDGTEYKTSASEWSAGVRAELPIGGWRVALDGGYGEHRFALADDAMPEELVPDVTYRWLRGALAITAPLTRRLALDAGGGWRQLLGTGDLGSDAWFPRSTGAGIDAELGITWRPANAVTFFARADLRRYFFAMNPEVGDPLIAGGAVDQYLAGVAGLSLSLR